MNANTIQLRQPAEAIINDIPPRRLRSALRFPECLRYGTDDPATVDLLRIPSLVERIRAAKRDVAAGRTPPLEKFKRKC